MRCHFATDRLLLRPNELHTLLLNAHDAMLASVLADLRSDGFGLIVAVLAGFIAAGRLR